MAQRLIQAYEVANYLAALGKFELAFQLYYHVQTYIRFRELYNNLGVALLKHYYQFSEDQLGYFPLEMEVDHPILRESAPPVTSTLDLAVEYLSRATHLDPGQYEAFLHLLIAYVWKKDDQQVESLIGKLNTYLTDQRQMQKLQIISGLYFRAKGNSASARSFFEKARGIAADPALTEMAVLNQQQLDLPERVRREIIPAPQFVQDVMDDQSFLNRIPAFDDTIRINDEYLLLVKFFPNSSLYHLQSKREKPTLKLQIADNRLPMSRKGIRIGSDQQQLFTTYEGTDGIKTGYTRGFYQIYPARGLIFRCNKAGKIDSWALFMF
jgi:tetratricopeptide (TPR) repeat protein